MKTKFILGLLILISLVLLGVGVFVGSLEVGIEVIKNVILHYDDQNPTHYAVVHLRLPRILLAFLVGAALSYSGYLIQALVNNPLADPYILGTASGASLGANLVNSGILPVSLLGISLSPILAFTGAMLVTVVASAIAYESKHINPSKLLLAGIAISTFTVSMVSLFLFFAETESKLKSIIFWSLGGFERADWNYIPLLFSVILFSTLISYFLRKHLHVLLLGENRSVNLGLNLVVFRWGLLVLISLNTGLAVATSGPIGFVGLMVPHFVRGLFGVTGNLNIFYVFWIGGIFMLTCDLVSRLIYPPAGLPIGIITSLIGIPFFVYLLNKSSYRFN